MAISLGTYDDSNSGRFKIWVDGSLEINTAASTFPSGGVAFGGYDADFENCKIGYDQNSDDDIDDLADGEGIEGSHSEIGKANKM